jgi:hypothetical protein
MALVLKLFSNLFIAILVLLTVDLSICSALNIKNYSPKAAHGPVQEAEPESCPNTNIDEENCQHFVLNIPNFLILNNVHMIKLEFSLKVDMSNEYLSEIFIPPDLHLS